MTVDLDDLTHLSELFTKLRSGRHLCVEDGPLYLSLRANYERYEAIFRALGFELVQHHREFYYFQSDADLAKESARLQSLQVKQQLGIQALSIANSAPSAILGYFR